MFPSIRISRHGVRAAGSFAETQAAYLDPDPAEVERLDLALARTGAGVVAHFYMDAELQGILARLRHPHVHVADSLQMAEHAVRMAEGGARAIVVLGVDFMSENIRATLDAAGHANVPVLRVSEAHIGCSLAASAETPSYAAYLAKAAKTPRSLHVIYVNTSLATKALAESRVPTITCTSSNVLRTVLEGARIAGAHVWFGPDSYMGHNVATLLGHLVALGDDAVRAVHPGHSAASVAEFLPRFHTFEQGVCVVHHLFGDSVVREVGQHHPGAFVAAHFEVPGGMFQLALDRSAKGRGVVGSTSNILEFIEHTVEREVKVDPSTHLSFVLGTESGMVSSIVERARKAIQGSDAEVEIVFPVASEAITAQPGASLPVVPGAATGEGCSVEGGCATCPYMKMNTLDALHRVLGHLAAGKAGALHGFEVPRPTGFQAEGATLGGAVRTIERMRAFQKAGAFPAEFLDAITGHRD